MRNPDYQINHLVNRLRQRGMRLTPQRMAVLKTLIGNKSHLSAEEIFEQVRVEYPMIGLATVYKTVTMLKEIGEITELNFGNQGARYDGSGEARHPHLVCTQCNRVLDVDEVIDLEETSLENLPKKIMEKSGYKISNYRLDFFGICPNCQSENKIPQIDTKKEKRC
jgi:Fur family peroxide stress response transcriptional regulator